MIKYIFLYILLFSSFAMAQNLELGISYGNSGPFRKSDDSHYNYDNQELGVYAIKNFAWKKNDKHKLKKYWLIQPQVYVGKYQFISEAVKETTLRAIVNGGLKLQKPFENWSTHAKFLIGAGYQSGLYQRLAKGIYFNEKLNLGIEYAIHPKLNTSLDMGVMHISNANIHKLNRGMEVFYIELGFNFP